MGDQGVYVASREFSNIPCQQRARVQRNIYSVRGLLGLDQPRTNCASAVEKECSQCITIRWLSNWCRSELDSQSFKRQDSDLSSVSRIAPVGVAAIVAGTRDARAQNS